MKTVYLAGRPNQYDTWREAFENVKGFNFYDPDSDQSSPDTFFPQDLDAVKNADILIANPGITPSEATWMEIGFFYALNARNVGSRCNTLIIIWPEDRLPKWSIELPNEAGILVSTVEESVEELNELV